MPLKLIYLQATKNIYRWSLRKNQSVWLWPADTTSSWFRPLVVIEWRRLSKGLDKNAYYAMTPLVMTKEYTHGVHAHNTTVVSFKLLVDRRQTASSMWVYSYSKKGCRREWRMANGVPKGTVVTLFDMQNFISGVHLGWKWMHQLWTFVWGFLTPRTKETHTFFNWKTSLFPRMNGLLYPILLRQSQEI